MMIDPIKPEILTLWPFVGEVGLSLGNEWAHPEMPLPFLLINQVFLPTEINMTAGPFSIFIPSCFPRSELKTGVVQDHRKEMNSL